MSSSDVIEIYTDGACSGNPGPGGWGVVLRYRGHEKELFGGEAETTNNRMEMMAVIKALEALTTRKKVVHLYTDSKYVMDGVTRWLEGWKARGWKTADKKPVKNQDLWERIDVLTKACDVRFLWVKGHAGHPENERADELARRGIPI